MSFNMPSGSRVYISPYNDITRALSASLEGDIVFLGYIDNYKIGDGIIKAGQELEFDYVIVDSPNHWKEISSQFESHQVLLHDKMNLKYVKLSEYESMLNEKLSFDVLLFPFNKSNIIDLSIVSRELKKLNISSALVDLGSSKDINLKEGMLENNDVEFIFRDQIPYIEYRCLLTSNDWHSMCNDFFKRERERGIITVGIVDGIEDFEDTDYKVKRYAYETTEYVLLMGSDDQFYFKHKIDKTRVIGLPKLWDIYHTPVSFPEKTLVMINLNFTYGYFESERDEWFNLVVSACNELGYEYIVSQHHADNGFVAKERKSTKNVYETIQAASIVVSRFSTVILESLASGKPVVYFNPHGEKVKIYKEPRGAYQLATTKEELKVALLAGLKNKADIHQRAHNFLDAKCFVSSSCPPGKAAANYICELLSNSK